MTDYGNGLRVPGHGSRGRRVGGVRGGGAAAAERLERIHLEPEAGDRSLLVDRHLHGVVDALAIRRGDADVVEGNRELDRLPARNHDRTTGAVMGRPRRRWGREPEGTECCSQTADGAKEYQKPVHRRSFLARECVDSDARARSQ